MRQGRRMLNLTGVTPVLATPFVADEIDHKAVASEVEWLVSCGCRSVAIGLASEIARLSEKERIELTRTVRAASPHEVTLVAACSADSTRALIELGSKAIAAGADALMITPPRVDDLRQDAVVQHFVDAGYLDAAIIVQDAPQETGVGISDGALHDIVDRLSSVVAVKLESPDALNRMDSLSSALQEVDVLMLGGSGGVDYVTEFGLGAAGTMPGPGLADVFLSIDQALRSDRHDAAAELSRRFVDAIGIGRRGMQPFIAAQKTYLAARGLRFPPELRKPAAELPDWLSREIARLTAEVASALGSNRLVPTKGQE